MIHGVQMSEQIGELIAAVAQFQTNLPKVAKGNTADVQSQRGSYKYSYADLTDVSAVTLPALAAQGLAWITMPNTHEDHTLYLDWMLAHTTGQYIRGSVPIGNRGDQWQNIGSAETYARRYALVALTGVAPGGDDNDGEGASAGAAPRPEAAKEYLPAGLYDLSTVDNRKTAERMFYTARGAGHLSLIVQTPEGAEVMFGDWLRIQGGKYPAVEPEDEPAEEAQADPDTGEVEMTAEEKYEADAIAKHEAELAAQEGSE